MDQASEIGTTPDVDQDAALLCSVSDQMHLDAHQKASICAPHPSRGRFRSSATTARCRVIGESSTKDSERDSRKVQSSFFTNERLSHKQQRSPSYVLQRHVLGKSQQSEETHHSANCPCCSGSIRTRGKLATARAGSATPTRLSAQPVGLQHLLQPKPACNIASQIATCPYSSLPSKGSHPLARSPRKTRCTNHVHSTPLSANAATTTKQKARSAASPASSIFPPSPTEHRPRSATKPVNSRHPAGQVRGDKADSAAEAELKALRQENAKLQSQLARLRSLRSQEEAARDSDISPDMPQAPASTPPWLSHKAADTHEPFLRNTQTSRGIKRASGMSPAPVKRRKANPDSQISPSRGIQADNDQRQLKLTCNSKLEQQEAGRCITPRHSSGLRPLPVIPPITLTDAHSQAFQLRTPKQSTAQEAAKSATQEQALQPSPDMPGVRYERPNSSGRSEAKPTQSPSLLHSQTWSPTQSQLSWQSPLTPLCQIPSQTRVRPQRMPLDTKDGSTLHLAAVAATDEAADEAADDVSRSHGTPYAFTMGSNPQAAELRQLPSDFHTQLAGLSAVPLFAERIQAPSRAADQLPVVDRQPAGLHLTSNLAPDQQMFSAQTVSPSLTQTQPDLQQPRAAAAEPFQLPSECPFPTQRAGTGAKAGQTSAAESEAPVRDQVVNPTPSKRKAGQPKKCTNIGKLSTPAASKQTSGLPQPEVGSSQRGRTADQLPAPKHDLNSNQRQGTAGWAKQAGATDQSAAAVGHQTPAPSRRRSSRKGVPADVSGPGPQLRSPTFSATAEAKQPKAAPADQRTATRSGRAGQPAVGRKTKQVPAAVSQQALHAGAVPATAVQVSKADDSLGAISEQAGGMRTGVAGQPNQTGSSDKPVVASSSTAAKLQPENGSQLLPADIASDLSQGVLAQTDRAAQTESPNREMVEMAVSSHAVEGQSAGAAVATGGKRAMPDSPLVKPPAKRHASATMQGLNPKFLAVKEQVARLIGNRKNVFESELRRSMGNNPDTSKALRTLWQEGVLDRGGIGGRMDPFRYSRKTLGAV